MCGRRTINQQLLGRDTPDWSSTSTGPQCWKKLLSLGNGKSSQLTDHEAGIVSGASGSHISWSSMEKQNQKGYRHTPM